MACTCACPPTLPSPPYIHFHRLQGGGAIHVGVPAFHPSAQCGAQEIIEYAAVNMSTVSFEGNVALDRGGAVHVVAGQLSMDVSGGRKWQLHWLAASL